MSDQLQDVQERPEAQDSTLAPPPVDEPVAEAQAEAAEAVSAAEEAATAQVAAEEPEPVGAAAEAPEPVEAAAEAPEPVEAAAEAPEPVEAAAEAPEPVEAAAEAPEPVEAAAEAPEPVEAAAEAPEPVEAPEPFEAAAGGTPSEAVEAAASDGGELKDEVVDLPLDISNQTPEMLALYDALLQKRSVEGQVIGWNKGGYHVAIDKIAAFCPVSQIEIGNPRSPKRYLDKKFNFHVIEIQKGGRRVVLSRAEALKAEREAIAAEVREKLKPGMVREGKISSITDFGAFVDLGGGIEGLVHVSEISRRRVEHPKEAVQVGQAVKVTVLKIEKGGQRISLSMKRLEEDPWSGIRDRFTPGDAFSGKVLRKADFGFFIEVEPGLEGLVHNSRLPLGSEEDGSALEVGATVEGWIHEIDAKRRRLSLSLRPIAKGNPWHGIEERFSEGTVIKGKVERLAPFGAFIELEPGLTGLLPFSAIGGTPANPRKQFHPGKEVAVRVLSIDREKRRISLGTEQSQAEGSHNDYREYKKKQSRSGGLNVMAAAFEKLKQQQADA